MPINQLETTLQAVTISIAHLEKEGCADYELLESLKNERDKILREMNLK
ncbi:MAG: hypothetical protein ACRCVG_02935 [Methanobacteriaceae archaeon]